MCGRFTRLRTWAELVRLYRLGGDNQGPPLPPGCNIAPGQDIAILRRTSAGSLALRRAHWGLIPHWAKDRAIAARTINARAETVDRLPSFRNAFRRRRCLVVADGFYEWRALPGRRKQPYYITLPEGRPFAFAGLWERWQPPGDAAGDADADGGGGEAGEAELGGGAAAGGGAVESCTIIVTAANPFLQPLHGRMPAILTPDRFEAWLDRDRPPADALALLAPFTGAMTVWPVATRVNSVRNDDPACLAPIGAAVTLPGDVAAALPAAGDLFG